ncbi:hypothetical protein AAG906_002403 [Vitis piasezkii]
MEEGVVKALDSDYSGDLDGLFPEILAVPEGDESLPGFQFKEEMVEEVMQELWKEISSPPARIPSPDLPGFVVGTSRESCGASFSDSASTVMAGVEMAGGGGGSGVVGTSLVGLAGRRAGRAAAGKGSAMEVAKEECYVPEFVAVGGERMDGCDGLEFDDEWLSRVLSWGPLDLDDWT